MAYVATGGHRTKRTSSITFSFARRRANAAPRRAACSNRIWPFRHLIDGDSMRHVFSATLVAVFAALTSSAFSADSMNMGAQAPMAMTMGYNFELAGPVQSNAGKSTVPVRIVHTADKKPVVGAIIIQSRADMGPIGMASMTAPIKALPVATPGSISSRFRTARCGKKPTSGP